MIDPSFYIPAKIIIIFVNFILVEIFDFYRAFLRALLPKYGLYSRQLLELSIMQGED